MSDPRLFLVDILIHAYRNVDITAVWEICDRDIPRIIPLVEDILRDIGVDPGDVPGG